MTIMEAIKYVMRKKGEPMTCREAYDSIIEQGLYHFRAQKPQLVVLSIIRRRALGLDFPSANATKHFKLVGENRFYPLDEPIKVSPQEAPKLDSPQDMETQPDTLVSSLRSIQSMHESYLDNFKRKSIEELRCMEPAAFELFAKCLLDVYGFQDTKVTAISNDGGIDGYGKLKVGLAYFRVAFQCKRWASGNIQRPEIDKFRGAIQGEYEQGVFFSTTSFSRGAIDASVKSGAVPIVLIDAEAIIELMISKRFGVQVETIDLPILALDLALDPNDPLESS
ncbi:MAG: restriction endonuclease [Candidatus Sumerlaeia bacterium]|nr:restriction endonuclease [Candidatus Sumerlaeia bacterium]